MDPASTHGIWADLSKPDFTPADSDFSVIGVPYDGGAGARKGAAFAPDRIRFWSTHLTPFSEDRTRLGNLRICDLGDIAINDKVRDTSTGLSAGFELVREKVAGLPNVPIVLGGDHSISIPVLRAQRERYKDQRLGLLWVDAHPDLCDVFTGSKLSHACVLRLAVEFGVEPRDVCMVGLRSWEEQEIDLIENGGFQAYTAAAVAERGMRSVASSVYSKLNLCDAVHISLDIDCLDPAFAPGTGIPESGGLISREVITLIKSLQGLPLVGLDVVEVAPPIDASEATVFAALKIIMEYIALFAREKQK
ncbi:MAG TPA: agmatinase [Anaerolineales bacterium]|nr:agmatinase [Anaerolineales bacterium]